MIWIVINKRNKTLQQTVDKDRPFEKNLYFLLLISPQKKRIQASVMKENPPTTICYKLFKQIRLFVVFFFQRETHWKLIRRSKLSSVCWFSEKKGIKLFQSLLVGVVISRSGLNGGGLKNLICDCGSNLDWVKEDNLGQISPSFLQKLSVITFALTPTHAHQMGHLEERMVHSIQEADYQTEIFSAAESNPTLEENQTHFLIYC